MVLVGLRDVFPIFALFTSPGSAQFCSIRCAVGSLATIFGIFGCAIRQIAVTPFVPTHPYDLGITPRDRVDFVGISTIVQLQSSIGMFSRIGMVLVFGGEVAPWQAAFTIYGSAEFSAV